MTTWRLLALLILFGVTFFFATILTVTAGIQNLVQFVLAWGVIFAASRLDSALAYVLSALTGAFLAIPASMYVYLPEHGRITLSRFFWQNFSQNFTSVRGYIGLFVYVLIACASQHLIRSLRPTIAQ